MAYKPPSSVGPIVVKHKGEFNLDGLVKAIRGFILAEYFQFYEPKHKYKPDEREIEIYGDRKVGEYLKYRIDVYIKAMDLVQKDVIKEGKAITVYDGRLIVELKGEMTLDPSKGFQGTWMSYIQDVWYRYIMRTTIEDKWMGFLEGTLAQLHGLVRKQLEWEAT